MEDLSGKLASFIRANVPRGAPVALGTGTSIVAPKTYIGAGEIPYDITLKALDQAQKQAPSDVRAPWFRASLLCQTPPPKAGADEFLSIEASHAWEQLSAAFWDDYIACASVTSMPAHTLRAADHLEKLHASE